MPTKFSLSLQHFPLSTYMAIRLPRPELVSVESIKYIDCQGDEQTLSTDDYRVNAAFAMVSLKSTRDWWPQTFPGVPGAVTIEYTAGKGEDQKPEFMQALRLLVGHWFRHREDTLEVPLHNIPHGVDTLTEHMRPGDEFDQVFCEIPRSYRYGY